MITITTPKLADWQARDLAKAVRDQLEFDFEFGKATMRADGDTSVISFSVTRK